MVSSCFARNTRYFTTFIGNIIINLQNRFTIGLTLNVVYMTPYNEHFFCVYLDNIIILLQTGLKDGKPAGRLR